MVVLTRLQAVPLSVLTSPFTIDAQSQLQPDPSDETTALLRVLIHEAEKPAFGNDVPTVPQWTDPPHAIVLAKAILYASLAASILFKLFAMLGKQWLNRYTSTDMRGTPVDRS